LKLTSRRPPLLLLIAIVVYGADVARAQFPKPMDSTERRLALERLEVLGTALYIGAHPDDENTAMLAYLEQERKLRTAYLSITRGDGGQNLIGPEQGDALGVIRIEELLAARSVDGAEQFFTRASDFGYSKTPEETLRIWDHQKVLSDIVWTIRSFRPDIVITRFPTTADGGHGHHTASATLAVEAFEAAGDAARFPEQLKWVSPWRPKRLLWNSWQPPGSPQTAPVTPRQTAVDLGTYNTGLGQAYTEIAAAGRSMHKSQGFGASSRRGTWPNTLDHLAGEIAANDILDGIDLTWGRVKGGEGVAALIRQAQEEQDESKPELLVPRLVETLDAMEKLPREPIVEAKKTDLLALIASCCGLWLDAAASSPTAVPGGSVGIKLSGLARCGLPVTCVRVQLNRHPESLLPETSLPNNRLITSDVTITIPRDAPYTHPYWMNNGANSPAASDPTLRGLPRDPPALTAAFTLRVAGRELPFRVPVLYRWTDPVHGERYRRLAVVPELTVSLESSALLFPEASPRVVRVTARSHVEAFKGTVTLSAPAGWKVEPSEIPVGMTRIEEERSYPVTITPPESDSTGQLSVTLQGSRAEPARRMITIDYPHIPPQVILPPAAGRLVRVSIDRPVSRIAYIEGAGDEVPGILRQIGFSVTLLDDDEIAEADLAEYPVIITGIRAYNTRQRLCDLQPRLLDYVAAGGTLLVQYNTDRGLPIEQLGPYPFKLSRRRTTEETAVVTVTRPDHPLLNFPHRITAADFDGWIQERGLNYPESWDSRYETLLSMGDSGEKAEEGAILFARHGKGTFIYTGLSFFRQLPAGVPGAVRLFVNLIAGGRPGA